jgi:hypothetical protein
MRTIPLTLAAMLGVMLFVLLPGCSDGRPRRVPVSGQVLVDGKPLAFGFVRLIPHKGRPASGQVDKEGRFRLTTYTSNDGCTLGTHAVEITSYNQRDIYSLIPCVPPSISRHPPPAWK